MFSKLSNLVVKTFNVICRKVKEFLGIFKKNEKKIKEAADTIVTIVAAFVQILSILASLSASTAAPAPKPS